MSFGGALSKSAKLALAKAATAAGTATNSGEAGLISPEQQEQFFSETAALFPNAEKEIGGQQLPLQ
jgi:glutamate synthase domain-containing protein 2